MTPDQKLEALARRIARRLFTNGAGERAQSMDMILPGGRNGGGWCEEAAADHILSVIKQSIRDDQITRG